MDRSSPISSAQNSDRPIENFERSVAKFDEGTGERVEQHSANPWPAAAVIIREIADRIATIAPGDEMVGDIADCVDALALSVRRWERSRAATDPRRERQAIADVLLAEFMRLYPRATPDVARASAEFREFCRRRTGVQAAQPEHVAPADARAEQSLRELGVDPVSAAQIVAQLGASTSMSIAGWVRGQHPRSPSGLLLAVARKRGYHAQ